MSNTRHNPRTANTFNKPLLESTINSSDGSQDMQVPLTVTFLLESLRDGSTTLWIDRRTIGGKGNEVRCTTYSYGPDLFYEVLASVLVAVVQSACLQGDAHLLSG